MKSITQIGMQALFTTSLLAAPAVQAKKYTNVVIINLDDAGYGDFSYNGAYGYSTPHIDKLARDGMQFTHFLAAQPISGASRAGLLTGCYPNRIGMHGAPFPNSDRGLNSIEMTLAELVKQKGYATAIFGKWHLGDAEKFLPLQHGFDEYYGLPYSNDMNPKVSDIFPGLPLIEGNKVIEVNPDQSQFTTNYTERSVDFIKRNKKKPFFLYLAHSMSHVPLAVSDKFKGKSEQGLYGDVMMELDWSVEQVMKTLRDLGLEENTLVVLTSDNGPWICYGNHAGSTGGLREGKAATFDGGNRVPCVMYWKGTIPSGTVCNKLTSNIDIFPTVAAITKAKLPKHKIDGVNILPLLKGDFEANPRKSFVYYFKKNNLEAVTDGSFKLVYPHKHRTYAFAPGKDGKKGKLMNVKFKQTELYDLRRDPGERYNVIDQYPDVVKKLNGIAKEMRKDLGDDLKKIKATNARPCGMK